jgi:hypothetical protein
MEGEHRSTFRCHMLTSRREEMEEKKQIIDGSEPP